MNLRLAVCATGAVLVHAVLLFGLHLDRNAVALAMSDNPTSVDVSLVEEAPPEQEVTPEPPPVEPPPEPPPPDSTPPPPDQTPPPPPTDEMTEPSPEPVQPRPPAPAPRPVHPSATKPAHPAPRPGAPEAPAGSTAGHAGTTAQARYRSNPKPEYPDEAKKMHEEGAVLLSVEVSAEGRVTGVSIVKSSGFSLLDQAAVSAVRRWTFVPATALGVPISSHPTVPIRFRLPTQ